MRSDTTADWNGSTIETPLFVDAPEVLLSVQELLGKKWHPVIVYELLENGPMGFSALKKSVDGISSKMLIQAANAVAGVRDARKFHVDAALDGVDFAAVVDEMDDLLSGIADGMEQRYREKEALTMYRDHAEFVDERTVAVDGQAVGGDRVVVAAGSRLLVPPIDGLDDVDYLTSRAALYLRERPDSLVVLGGGYIAVELGYFFEMLGTDVTTVEMEDSLVPREDGDVAAAFTDIAAERHTVYTGYRATAVERNGTGVTVHAETADGDEIAATAGAVLVALGRRHDTRAPDARQGRRVCVRRRTVEGRVAVASALRTDVRSAHLRPKC